MYKVLIVDDEKMICMGMKKAISWEKLGVDQVYTASSAAEAMEILEENHPQIMITDIQMSGITGLELIEKTRDIVPELRVIVLTGYDNFEYVRQSLRLQVQDFFLKPIEEEDLSRAIRKQVAYLDEAEEEKRNFRLRQRTQGTVEQIELEKCIRGLIKHPKESSQSIDTLERYYGLPVDQELQIVLIIPDRIYPRQGKDQDFHEMSVKYICMSVVDAQGEGITFTEEEGNLGIVYFAGGESSVLEHIEELTGILKDEFDTKFKIVVGSAVTGYAHLYISYNDAKYLLNTEKESIHDVIQTIGERNKNNIFRDIYSELKGIMCSNTGNTEYVMKTFHTFTKAVQSYNLSQKTVRRLCFEIASATYFAYMVESKETEFRRLDALSKSLLSANREEACEVTEMFLNQMLGKEEESGHELVDKAKYYISEHLTENFTVSDIAASLYITPNYFSRLFKRVTKEGCNEYIVRKRIEKAKYLLETTSLKMGKIAMMVGYRDTNYFSLAFKKYTGKSPTKYREEVRLLQAGNG